MAAKLISNLMHSRTQAHVFHLRTNSFSAHKALQEYYEGIVPLFDEYAESYQGRYGLISGYTIGSPLNQNPMKARMYFQRLLKIVDSTKIKDSYLKNLLDSIRQLVYQTLYLLTLDRGTNGPSSTRSNRDTNKRLSATHSNRDSNKRMSATHSNKSPSSNRVLRNRQTPTNRNK